ncbi:MAG TPA: proline--tRNA ligase [Candidatus Binataceae bacterium]|jgi:prolyl-tRNA synthetase|nr:proline--tRNA ligase [Candidatus Binataceae bacterium]
MADKQDEKKVTPRSQDFAAWYNEVIARAELADYSPVRGCIVFRPDGFAIWEALRDELDRRIKRTGARNAYFPLFIPQSFLQKEAQHVEGFAPEVAVVTHGGGKELEEPLIVRPTSETIINHMFAQWIHSHRDLPLMINQWCNVVRWEMRTRPFLRTAEFLWQEGHTAHATRTEAEEEALTMLEVYRGFVEDYLAVPLVSGRKSAAERFPGAEETYAIESLMADGRALQCGTSHYLGQNFARAFEIRFLDEHNQLQHPHQTSWGVSTRLLGAIIMTHGDDQGLRLPPAVAPWQAAVVPIWRKDEERQAVLGAARAVREVLERAAVRVKLDDREGLTPGFKFNDWEMRGVPVRIEIGPRDVAAGSAMLARRDQLGKQGKAPASLDAIATHVSKLLDEIQKSLYAQARDAMRANTRQFDDYARLRAQMEGEGGGGMADVYWCGSAACEIRVREETRATCRAIPLGQNGAPGRCIVCGQAAKERAFFAKAY